MIFDSLADHQSLEITSISRSCLLLHSGPHPFPVRTYTPTPPDIYSHTSPFCFLTIMMFILHKGVSSYILCIKESPSLTPPLYFMHGWFSLYTIWKQYCSKEWFPTITLMFLTLSPRFVFRRSFLHACTQLLRLTLDSPGLGGWKVTVILLCTWRRKSLKQGYPSLFPD